MSDKLKNHMTPIDAGAPVLIPQGNLNPDGGGSYGAILKAFEDAEKGQKFTSGGSLYPGFTPGFTCCSGEWQTMTNSTAKK
jgi:hypothetical protein